jgi:hypothetical protein
LTHRDPEALGLAAIAIVAAACTDHARYVIVDIDAPAGAPDVVQLRIDAAVGSDVGTLIAPTPPAAGPLKWPESFSLELPEAASGTARLFVTAMDSSGCEAMVSVTEFPTSSPRVSLTLASVASGACLVPGTPIARSFSAVTMTGTTSLSIPIPAGTAQDDVLIAFIGMVGGTNHSVDAPTDWSAIPNMDWTESSTGTRSHAFWKLASATEPTSYLFTETGGNLEDIDGTIIAVAGADTTHPIEASNGQINAASSSCPSPSLTTTTDHTLVLYACAMETGSVGTALPFAPPSAMEQLATLESTGTYKTAEEAAWGSQTTAGMTTQFAATASTSRSSVGLILAIAGQPATP